ncbi:MAG: alpha/beta fold hydrolase [Niabella sp.]
MKKVTSILILFFAILSACKTPSKENENNSTKISPLSDTLQVQHTTQLEDATIEYFTMGNPSGKVVALLPGGSLNVNYMQGLAKVLAKKGYYVIAVNPRGAGNSTGKSDSISMHDLGNDVMGVLHAEHIESACVVGHAYGNRIARIMATDHPENVNKVVLIAAGGKFPPKDDASKALKEVFSDGVTEQQLINSVKYMVGDSADAFKAAAIIKNSLAPKSGPIERVAAEHTLLQEWWAPKGTTQFLILQGTKDQIAPPRNGEDLKKDLGNRAEMVYLEGAGHLMIITRPEEVSEKIINFLEN